MGQRASEYVVIVPRIVKSLEPQGGATRTEYRSRKKSREKKKFDTARTRLVDEWRRDTHRQPCLGADAHLKIEARDAG